MGALKYLAPYIFRVAIGNQRILKLKDDQVRFRYRDTDTGQERVCTMGAEEFIRRFWQHVLPKGFVKVRYYGIFSSGWRKRLAGIRRRLKGKAGVATEEQEEGVEKAMVAVPAEHVMLCPHCGRPMRRQRTLPARGRCPP